MTLLACASLPAPPPPRAPAADATVDVAAEALHQYLRGVVHLEAGRCADAVLALQTALRFDADGGAVLRELGLASLACDDPQGAWDTLEAAAAAGHPAWAAQAEAAVRLDDGDALATVLTRWTDPVADPPQARLRGLARMQVGDPSGAVDDLSTWLRTGQADPWTLRAFHDAAVQAPRLGTGLLVARRLVADRPSDAAAWTLLLDLARAADDREALRQAVAGLGGLGVAPPSLQAELAILTGDDATLRALVATTDLDGAVRVRVQLASGDVAGARATLVTLGDHPELLDLTVRVTLASGAPPSDVVRGLLGPMGDADAASRIVADRLWEADRPADAEAVLASLPAPSAASLRVRAGLLLALGRPAHVLGLPLGSSPADRSLLARALEGTGDAPGAVRVARTVLAEVPGDAACLAVLARHIDQLAVGERGDVLRRAWEADPVGFGAVGSAQVTSP